MTASMVTLMIPIFLFIFLVPLPLLPVIVTKLEYLVLINWLILTRIRSRHVRYASNSDRVGASEQNVALCHERL